MKGSENGTQDFGREPHTLKFAFLRVLSRFQLVREAVALAVGEGGEASAAAEDFGKTAPGSLS
jgi:hypothetical protein